MDKGFPLIYEGLCTLDLAQKCLSLYSVLNSENHLAYLHAEHIWLHNSMQEAIQKGHEVNLAASDVFSRASVRYVVPNNPAEDR